MCERQKGSQLPQSESKLITSGAPKPEDAVKMRKGWGRGPHVGHRTCKDSLLSRLPPETEGGYQETGAGPPGGAVDKNPPANAQDTGSVPGPGGSHMLQNSSVAAPQPLNLCATAATREACTLQLESGPCSSQLEKALEQQPRLRTANK